MVNLAQRWAEEYMKFNENISVQVTGGGSGTGIASLLNETADIANISRELKEKEINRAESRNVKPVRFKVALDGIAVIVHPSNNIDTLTLSQVRAIFSGKITNWSEVGGADRHIVLYGRENSSGTYEYFLQNVLNQDTAAKQLDFASSTQVLQGTASLGESVARDENGIGYGGVGYFANRNDLKILHLKENSDSKAISPATDNQVNFEVIRRRIYPLSRNLYCYTNGKPEGEIKKFIDFVVSKRGQKIVKDMEFIPLFPVSENKSNTI